MGERYLIDSNIIIKVATQSQLNAEVLDFIYKIISKEFNISVINKIELLSKNNKLQAFINHANVFFINDLTAEIAINLRQKKSMKTPDAIIAATAIENDLILLTNNIKDFENIKGLNVVDPLNLNRKL